MKVKFELTGQEDIMIGRCVNDNEGIGKVYADANGTAFKQQHPKFEFEHLLTRFNFKLQRGVGYGDRLRVNALHVYDVENELELDVLNGNISINPKTTSTMTVEKDVLNVSIVSATPYSSVICGERTEIRFNVISMGIEYPEITIDAATMKDGSKKFEAGKSYDIILMFTGVDLQASVSLANWENGGTSDETIVIN